MRGGRERGATVSGEFRMEGVEGEEGGRRRREKSFALLCGAAALLNLVFGMPKLYELFHKVPSQRAASF